MFCVCVYIGLDTLKRIVYFFMTVFFLNDFSKIVLNYFLLVTLKQKHYFHPRKQFLSDSVNYEGNPNHTFLGIKPY